MYNCAKNGLINNMKCNLDEILRRRHNRDLEDRRGHGAPSHDDTIIILILLSLLPTLLLFRGQ